MSKPRHRHSKQVISRFPEIGKIPQRGPWVRSRWGIPTWGLYFPCSTGKGKRKFTRLCTSDIDLSSLRHQHIKSFKDAPIFINEYLNHDKYINFTQLTSVAKNLGFKFVWQRCFFLNNFSNGTFNSAQCLMNLSYQFTIPKYLLSWRSFVGVG